MEWRRLLAEVVGDGGPEGCSAGCEGDPEYGLRVSGAVPVGISDGCRGPPAPCCEMRKKSTTNKRSEVGGGPHAS